MKQAGRLPSKGAIKFSNEQAEDLFDFCAEDPSSASSVQLLTVQRWWWVPRELSGTQASPLGCAESTSARRQLGRWAVPSDMASACPLAIPAGQQVSGHRQHGRSALRFPLRPVPRLRGREERAEGSVALRAEVGLLLSNTWFFFPFSGQTQFFDILFF